MPTLNTTSLTVRAERSESPYDSACRSRTHRAPAPQSRTVSVKERERERKREKKRRRGRGREGGRARGGERARESGRGELGCSTACGAAPRATSGLRHRRRRAKDGCIRSAAPAAPRAATEGSPASAQPAQRTCWLPAATRDLARCPTRTKCVHTCTRYSSAAGSAPLGAGRRRRRIRDKGRLARDTT